MAKIISIHSFRGGTGKSNVTANLAMLLAQNGGRVGVVDTDLQSPGLHVLFGLNEELYTLNEYLWGKCAIKQAAYDVTSKVENGLGSGFSGKVYLIPASGKTGEIARILREGYDVGLLKDGFHRLLQELQLDALLIDTHPGLNEETLLSLAVSDALVVLLRPDQQDYQGTSVTLEVARRLKVPELWLLINQAPASIDPDVVKIFAEEMYGAEVVAVLRHSDEMMALASAGIFALRHPDHPLAITLRQVAAKLAAEQTRSAADGFR
jgi:MinD-like ATPase involved in chromosome partitioning or flagellar assembly